MRVNKYINTDIQTKATLSRGAYALLLPLILLSNQYNEVNKKKFIYGVSWISDYRTWNKYWKELINKDVLVHLDKQVWMLSPYECYADGISQARLINKWNEARNAIS